MTTRGTGLWKERVGELVALTRLLSWLLQSTDMSGCGWGLRCSSGWFKKKKKRKKLLTWLPMEITEHKKLSNRDQQAPRKSPSNKRELKQCIAATKTQPRQVESSPVGSGWKDINLLSLIQKMLDAVVLVGTRNSKWNRKESFSSVTKYFKTPAVQCDDAKALKPGRAGRLGDLTWDVFAASK